MSITMRIIQHFDPTKESEFLELERKFEKLENKRSDYPNGKRMVPISGNEPCNAIIWQHEFPDLDSAHKTLDFFSKDDEHERLFEKQSPFIRKVKIEFYENF